MTARSMLYAHHHDHGGTVSLMQCVGIYAALALFDILQTHAQHLRRCKYAGCRHPTTTFGTYSCICTDVPAPCLQTSLEAVMRSDTQMQTTQQPVKGFICDKAQR